MAGEARRTSLRKCLLYREAPVGIEPTNRGFADLCLTTWLRRRRGHNFAPAFGFLNPQGGAPDGFTPPQPPMAGSRGPLRSDPDGAVRHRTAHGSVRSEEHTSELQSLAYLVCRLL